MIVAKLTGGLGNQMFQYAAARALARARATRLYLDVSWYEHLDPGTTARSYELDHLQVVQRFVGRFARWRFARVARGGIGRWIPGHAYVRQTSRRFDSTLLRMPVSHVYLDGYWQSEKYFADARDLLLREFSVQGAPEGENVKLLQEIRESNSVSVHVRRGDYLSNPKASALHGACSLEYYRDAARHVAKHVAAPKFFVFSDEPATVRDELGIDGNVRYVGNNPADRGHEDLRLMTHCKHFIVANSSFSWWGAWLGTATDKVVVAPERWFADPSADEGDIVPSSWVRI
jgi:hypothetical protein